MSIQLYIVLKIDITQHCEFVLRFSSIPHKPVLYSCEMHSGLATDMNITKGHFMEGLEAPSVHESAKPENFHHPLESFAYETCFTVVRGF